MNTNDLLDGYWKFQQAGALSPKTMKRRAGTIRRFARMVGDDLLAADGDDVIDFLNRYDMPKTKHAYRSDLLGFYMWAVQRRYMATNPVLETKKVKLPKPVPRPIGPEVDRALTTGRLRVRRMVGLGLYAGLRCAEIASLDGSDIMRHLRPPMLLVRDGKGGKDRQVPICPELGKLLDGVPASGPVFPGQRGNTYVSPGAVSALISRHMKRCGINAVPHQLRHTFGTLITQQAGGNIMGVMRVMGHASPNTTQGYVAWGGDEADLIGRAFPSPPDAA